MTLFEQSETIDPNKDYFSELVGEGKKYADEKALAYALMHADNHIKRIESENSEMRTDFKRMRDDYNAVPKLQELLDQLTEQQQLASRESPESNEDQTPALTLDQVKSLFSDTYKEQRAQETYEQNYNSIQNKLRERYGDNASKHLKSQMNDLGMTQEEVEVMARRHPRTFERLFLAAPKTETFEAPMQSTHRETFSPTGGAKRDWKYYEKLRVEKPDVYWDVKTQNQMHKDAEELGDNFDNS